MTREKEREMRDLFEALSPDQQEKLIAYTLSLKEGNSC